MHRAHTENSEFACFQPVLSGGTPEIFWPVVMTVYGYFWVILRLWYGIFVHIPVFWDYGFTVTLPSVSGKVILRKSLVTASACRTRTGATPGCAFGETWKLKPATGPLTIRSCPPMRIHVKEESSAPVFSS